MSIVDAIKTQLSGDVLSKLSGLVGESEEGTRTAANAAIPAILSMLAGAVSGGKAQDALLDALRGFDGVDPVSTLRPPVDAPGTTAGTPPGDILGSILGPNLSTLINVLSKFSGVGLSTIKTLISYLGPFILSVLAAQLKGRGGLSAANLASMFTAEKANIAKALPAGLSLGDLSSTFGGSTGSAGHAPAPPARPHPVEEPGLPGWLLPLLALALLGLGAWYFFSAPPPPPPGGPAPAPAPAPGQVPSEPAPAPTAEAPPATIPALPTADEVTARFKDVYAGATQALADVKDDATAELAAPKLAAADLQLDALKPLWEKVPAEVKATILKATAENLDAFKSLAGRVLEIPGVGEKLKPAIDAMLAKLAGFTA